MQAARSDNLLIQEYFFEEIPVLRLQMERPELPPTATAAAGRRIGRYYRRLELFCLSLCRKSLLPAISESFRLALAESRPFSPAVLSLRYTVTLAGPERFSLYWDLSLTGNKPSEEIRLRFADTWNLSTGYPVSMASLFPPGYKYKKLLSEAAARSLSPAKGRRDPNLRLFRRLFSERSFYLDESHIYYFFPSQEQPFGNSGVSVFSAPLPPPERKPIENEKERGAKRRDNP